MITSDTLLTQIANTIGKSKVLELSRILTEEQFALRDLIAITFHHDEQIAFRAAWILENVILSDPTWYEADLAYLVEKMKEVKHPGCQRHYVKVIVHLTAPKAITPVRERLKAIDLEPVAEMCFDLLINPKVKIAVKVFASEALCNLRYRYPWITDELAPQLQFLMRSGSAGIQSRGKKLLGLLREG